MSYRFDFVKDQSDSLLNRKEIFDLSEISSLVDFGNNQWSNSIFKISTIASKRAPGMTMAYWATTGNNIKFPSLQQQISQLTFMDPNQRRLKPEKMKSLEQTIHSLNGEFIECPVGGSTKPARDGNLLGLVGGNKKTFEKIEYILKLICKRYEYLGEVGKGTAMKLAINLPLMVYWQALGEAMSIATNSGIKFDKALDIMMDSSGAAKVAHLKSNIMLQAIKNENNLGSTFNVSSSLKDINLMIEEGEKFNNQLHVIKSTKSYVQAAVNDGWSDHDASLLSVYINKKLRN